MIDKRPNGQWRARYTHPFQSKKPDGSNNRITAPATFATKAKARLWLAQVQARIADGTWQSPEEQEAQRLKDEAQAKQAALTFATYAESWMKSRNLSPSTRRSYTSNLDTHLLPRWGQTPLQEITTMDVRIWLGQLAPGAKGARRHAFDLFKSILATAVDDEIIMRNPCTRNMLNLVAAAPKPKGKKKQREREPHALTRDQLHALADEVPEYMRLLVLLSGRMGFRSGEIRALRGGDVTRDDAGRLWIHITKSVTGQGKNQAIGSPKTEKSMRTIPAPTSLADQVEERAQQAGKNGLLFPGKQDPHKPMPERTYQLNLDRAGERIGIGHVSPHDLRHTCASDMIANNVPPTVVRDYLGHTTTSMTDRYTHTSHEEMARAVDIADVDLGPMPEVASLDTRRA